MFWNKRMYRAIYSSSRGFTLIEVIVALTVLAVGILGVVDAFSSCGRVASHSLRVAQAMNIVQKELELASVTPASSLAPKTGSVGQYSWQVEFAEKPHGLVRATVEVRWTEQGKPQVFQLSQIFRPRS